MKIDGRKFLKSRRARIGCSGDSSSLGQALGLTTQESSNQGNWVVAAIEPGTTPSESHTQWPLRGAVSVSPGTVVGQGSLSSLIT